MSKLRPRLRVQVSGFGFQEIEHPETRNLTPDTIPLRLKRPPQRIALLCAVVAFALLTGCVTTPDKANEELDMPLSAEQIQDYYRQAKDPRQFWITVYSSENGPTFSGAQRLHQGQKVEISYKQGEPTPVPVITFKGHGHKEYKGLIDTSAAENWVEFVSAAAMRAIPLGLPGYSTTPMHVPDDVEGYLCVMDRIRLEELYMETGLLFARGAIGSLGPLARGVEKPQPMAVLGMRFLGAFSYVQFDFGRRKIVFSSTTAYRPSETALIASVPIEKDAGGALAVSGTINGRPETIILDTGGNYTVALQETEHPVLRHLSLGDLLLQDLDCTTCDEAGLGLEAYPRVGLKALSRFVLTIDNTASMVHFEKPRK